MMSGGRRIKLLGVDDLGGGRGKRCGSPPSPVTDDDECVKEQGNYSGIWFVLKIMKTVFDLIVYFCVFRC